MQALSKRVQARTRGSHGQVSKKIRNKSYKYHPTSGLMQILHFDWLRY